MTEFTLVKYASALSILAPVLFLAKNKWLLKIKFVQWLALYTALIVIVDAVMAYIRSLNIPTLIYANLFTLVEILILTAMFSLLIPKRKLLFWCLTGAFIVFFIIDSLLWEPIQTSFQAYSFLAECCVMLVCCYFFLRKLLLKDFEDAHIQIGKIALFASFTAYFFYNGLFFSVNNYAELDPWLKQNVWKMEFGVNIIKNILLAVGLYKMGKGELHLVSIDGVIHKKIV